jgi:hypothetical protein
MQTKGKFTCYYCKEDGHIKPNCPKLLAGVPKTDDKQKERRPLAAWKTVRPKDLTKVFIDENKVEWNFCTKCIDFTTKRKCIWSRTHPDAEHKTSSCMTPEDAVKTEETEKVEANLTLIETDVPIGPPLTTTREPSVDVDPNELVFTPGAWCCPIPLVLPSHTSSTPVHCPIDCHDEESIDIPILGIRRDDNSSDDDSSDDELASDDEGSVNDEGSVELDTFPLYYDNEPIINQTTENQEHQMGKEKEDKNKTWTAMTYLATLMLTGIACTTAGIQWSLGTMNNSLVRVFFEPIWSTLVLPLFFIDTVIWDLARFLVESPDLQESSKKKERDNIQTITTQTDSSRITTNHMAPSVVLLHQHLGNYDRICHVIQRVLPRTDPRTSLLPHQSATCRDLHTDGSPGQTCSSVTWCAAAISKNTSAATVVRNATKTSKIKRMRETRRN